MVIYYIIPKYQHTNYEITVSPFYFCLTITIYYHNTQEKIFNFFHKKKTSLKQKTISVINDKINLELMIDWFQNLQLTENSD